MIAEFDKKIMIRTSEEQYLKLKKLKNFSEIIRKLIDEYLEKNDNK